MLKKKMTKVISSSNIDEIYEAGRRAGALGGKLLGAGGGGFMLFYAKPELQPKIKKALKGLLHVPFYFEHIGSQVIYYSK
jgi:D-glycero-alpha-D-manno-heptose-7-phosphate kinase